MWPGPWGVIMLAGARIRGRMVRGETAPVMGALILGDVGILGVMVVKG